MVTCTQDGQCKYVLDRTTVLGKIIKARRPTSAAAGVGDWVVNLNFDSKGAKNFANVTGD